jgi:ABC-2 type transport system permease protein
MRTILNLTWKEFIQLIRDRVLVIFLIVVPVAQLLLIAEATGSGVRGIKFAVWDLDQSQLSQDLVRTLDNSEEFKLLTRAQSYDEVKALLDRGDAKVALIIPPDFSRAVMRTDAPASLTAIIDGTNVIVANSVLGAIEGAVNDLARQLLAGSGMMTLSGIDIKIDLEFNPTLNIRWSSLTAQLPFITYQLVLVVAAVGFVRERELGTMEQLVVTPISRLDLMLGKGLMALAVGILNFFLLALTLTQGFQIPLRGDIVMFTLLGLLFIVTEIGVGTLISMVVTSQQQSILVVFLLAMLEVTFSGYLVPTDNMPAFMQFFALLSPLQHFTAITREVFLKGSSLAIMLDHVIPLWLLAVGSLGAAWALFVRAEVG